MHVVDFMRSNSAIARPKKTPKSRTTERGESAKRQSDRVKVRGKGETLHARGSEDVETRRGGRDRRHNDPENNTDCGEYFSMFSYSCDFSTLFIYHITVCVELFL